ncbi:MAG: hypothetical protein ABIF10_02925, partial [Candidatus Woesearchaeota archaeon]
MRWICFTGVDGSGKKTLRDYTFILLEKNYSVFKFQSPPSEWVRPMLDVSGNARPLGDVYTDHLIFCAALRAEMYNIKK